MYYKEGLQGQTARKAMAKEERSSRDGISRGLLLQAQPRAAPDAGAAPDARGLHLMQGLV